MDEKNTLLEKKENIQYLEENKGSSFLCKHERKVFLSEECIEISSPTGETELSIRLTPEGPVLVFSQGNLKMHIQGDLAMNCQSFHLNTSKSIVMQSSEMAFHSDHMHLHGEKISLEGADLKAHAKDISLNGETIHLNS